MANNTDKQGANELITNRVTVSKNANSVRVSVKAPNFSMGNNLLTLCFTVGVAGEFLLSWLMIKSNVDMAILVPGFFLLAAGLGLGFVKLWLWHNFGEELINIRGNSFEMHRNYGLFKSDAKRLVLNKESELYTNRTDRWSWRQFRGKGIFRLATEDASITDFGLKLDDQEFEMILRPVAEQLEKLKEKTSEIELTEPESMEPEPAKVVEIKKVEPELPKEVQPPSLAQQTEGQHRAALNDYLDKAAGIESSDEEKSEDIEKREERA